MTNYRRDLIHRAASLPIGNPQRRRILAQVQAPVPAKVRDAFNRELLPGMVELRGVDPVDEIQDAFLELLWKAKKRKDDYYQTLVYYRPLDMGDVEYFEFLERLVYEWE